MLVTKEKTFYMHIEPAESRFVITGAKSVCPGCFFEFFSPSNNKGVEHQSFTSGSVLVALVLAVVAAVVLPVVVAGIVWGGAVEHTGFSDNHTPPLGCKSNPQWSHQGTSGLHAACWS